MNIEYRIRKDYITKQYYVVKIEEESRISSIDIIAQQLSYVEARLVKEKLDKTIEKE